MTELPRPEFLVEVEAFAVANAAMPRLVDASSGEEPRTLPKARPPERSCSCPPATAAPPKLSPKSIEQEVSTALDNVRRALGRAGSAIGKSSSSR